MDARLKRLLFRSRHRGMQETDILLGGFAERHLGELNEAQLDRFETILEQNDADLFDWISGKKAVPGSLDDDVMRLLKTFREALARS